MEFLTDADLDFILLALTDREMNQHVLRAQGHTVLNIGGHEEDVNSESAAHRRRELDNQFHVMNERVILLKAKIINEKQRRAGERFSREALDNDGTQG